MRGLLSVGSSEAWELDPQVAIRPEPFGGLAYHYGNRRLTFLRARELVDLVEHLGEHGSVDAALEAAPIAPSRHGSFLKALDTLAASEIIRKKP